MPKTRTGLRIRVFHIPSAVSNGNGTNGVDDYSAVIPPPLSHTPGPSPLFKPLSQSLPVSPTGSFSLGPPKHSSAAASSITVTDATLEDLLSGAYLRTSFTQKSFFEPINVETTPLSRPTTPSAAQQPGASAQRIWIQISNFGSSASNSALLQKIGAHFRLHPLTITDLQSEDTREKLEVFPEYMLLCIHAIQQPTPTIFDIVSKERVDKARDAEEKKLEQERQYRASRFFGGILHRRQPPLRSQSHPALPLSAPIVANQLPPIQYDEDVNPFDDISTTSLDASYVDEEEHLLGPKKRPSRNGIFQSAGLTTSAIKLIVFPHVVISFHHGLQQSEINAVCRRLNQFSESRMDTGAWIMHAMLDTITSSMQPIVDEAVEEIDRLEELIYALDGQQFQDLLKRMGLTRRRLVALTQQVKSKSSIINSMLEADRKQQTLQSALSSSPSAASASVQSPYLRDVYDHLDQQNVKIDCAAQVLHALQDSYLATVQLHAETMSHDINKVMKTFSAFATIMLPLSLIAGILGMNVEVPSQVWERGDGPSLDSLTPFWTVVSVMIGIALLLYLYFRRRGYL